ncbi:MAG: hypothetical protein E6Q97_22355 [Desulfurellales bacterium]|nr:MAG: hypothetical protein E6Q97_22355 [Desulfurellales bacterium]
MLAYLKDHPEVIASVLAFAGALLRLLDNRLKARALLAAPSEEVREKIANLPPVSGVLVLLLAAAALVSCLMALVRFEQHLAAKDYECTRDSDCEPPAKCRKHFCEDVAQSFKPTVALLFERRTTPVGRIP